MYLREMIFGHELDSYVSGYGPVATSCKHGNEPLGYVKDGVFLD
jgi:hypothetical protein